MSNPTNLQYSKSHEWVLMNDDGTATIGLTYFAQDSLGSIVFVELPEEDDTLTAGESFGEVESVKAVSDINAPVSGTVTAINEELEDAPEKINEDPYGAWLVKVSGVGDKVELLSAADYEAFCKEEE